MSQEFFHKDETIYDDRVRLDNYIRLNDKDSFFLFNLCLAAHINHAFVLLTMNSSVTADNKYYKIIITIHKHLSK